MATRWLHSNRPLGEIDEPLATGTRPPGDRKKKRKRKRAKRKKETVKKLRAMPYQDYLNSRHWRETRQRAFDRYGRKCTECGCTENLQVHHLTYARLGREDVRDLKVLCCHCHELEHEDRFPLSDPLSREFREMVAAW